MMALDFIMFYNANRRIARSHCHTANVNINAMLNCFI